jgi:FAD synthetase
MVKVLTFGTFDKYHPGHEYYLKNAKKYGEVYVIIARDSTVKQIKGKLPENNEKTRLQKINSLKYVKKAYLGDLKDKFKLIKELKPDIICLGYDQNSFNKNLEDKLKELNINAKIIRFKDAYKPNIYKSSKIRG